MLESVCIPSKIEMLTDKGYCVQDKVQGDLHFEMKKWRKAAQCLVEAGDVTVTAMASQRNGEPSPFGCKQINYGEPTIRLRKNPEWTIYGKSESYFKCDEPSGVQC